MKRSHSYSMSLGKNSSREQHLDFALNDDFFAIYPESLVKKGDCKAEICAIRHSSFVETTISITGDVTVECDRCLEELILPINFSSKLLVKLSTEVQDTELQIDTCDEDIIWANPNDDKLDLTQYLFDSVCLSLPFSCIHGENGNTQSCNSDMLARFITEEV